MPQSPQSLADAFQSYLSMLRNSASNHISAAAQQAINLFSTFIRIKRDHSPSSTPVTDLRVGWAKDFLRQLQTTHSTETEHLYMRSILSFYIHANQQQWVDLDTDSLSQFIQENRRSKQHTIPDPPFELMEKIIAYVAHAPQPLSVDDSLRDRLIFARNKAFLLTLADTGFKVSEICALRLDNLDLDTRCISLPPAAPLEISGQSSAAIKAYLSLRRSAPSLSSILALSEQPLFSRHDKRAGNRILPLSRWTAAAIVNQWTTSALSKPEIAEMEQNDQEITPNTFRHYFILKTLSHTDDLEVVQNLARHADPSTTRRYLRKIAQQSDDTNEGN